MFSLENLRQVSQNDETLLQLLIETMAESLPQELDKLKEAIENTDPEWTKQILHKIKPSISYLGDQDLIDKRAELHDTARDGFLNVEQLTMFVTQVRETLQQFLEEYG